MKHGSLFSGIGGFDLAAEWMGWENIFHCEWNEFGQKVLNYYWPKAISYNDITKTDFTIHRGTIDILTGGFPCQPYSMAGKRKGKEDTRHLWPEMLRAIREIQPKYIVGENVLGLTNWNGGLVFNEVQIEMEAQGYEVQPFILPACGINAPHRRERVWFIAYSNSCRDYRTERSEGSVRKQSDKEQPRDRGAMQVNGPSHERVASHTENIRHGHGQNIGCEQSRENIKSEQIWDNEVRSEYIGFSDKRAFADPNCCAVRKICGNEACNRGEYKEHTLNSDIGIPKPFTNTSIEGLQRGNGTQKPIRSEPRSEKTDWSNWPTQSPVCDGNDGLSPKLDGITFPKWRNESIKAGGNAIVPQIALQIFKAIEEYHQLNLTPR